MSAPVQSGVADRASRRARLFGVTLLATVLVSTLDLPWRLSGLGFGAAALYSGIKLLLDLARLRNEGRPAGGLVGVAVGLAVTVFMMMIFAGQAAFYPLFAEQERCTKLAATHLDSELCRERFQQRQQELIDRLQGRS